MIVEGMRDVVTHNIYTESDLVVCNGSIGFVTKVVFHDDESSGGAAY
jgi:hypothetical protein